MSSSPIAAWRKFSRSRHKQQFRPYAVQTALQVYVQTSTGFICGALIMHQPEPCVCLQNRHTLTKNNKSSSPCCLPVQAQPSTSKLLRRSHRSNLEFNTSLCCIHAYHDFHELNTLRQPQADQLSANQSPIIYYTQSIVSESKMLEAVAGLLVEGRKWQSHRECP